MGRICTIVLIQMFIGLNMLSAQDLIITIYGNEIKSKVIEISETEIRYKNFDDLEGPVRILNKGNICFVKYENGHIEMITKYKLEQVNTQSDLYKQAKVDMELFYGGRNSGEAWVGVSTFLIGPILGLIPASACASTPPSMANLNIPPNMLENKDYVEYYKQFAKQKKQRKVWGGYTKGSIILLVFAFVYFR